MLKRVFFGVGLVALSAHCFADRLINLPTGRKLLANTARVEVATSPNQRRFLNQYLAFSLEKYFDFELRSRLEDPYCRAFTGDIGLNLIPQFPGTAPGLSVGVLDAGDFTDLGRRFYAALSITEYLDRPGPNVLEEIVLGYQRGRTGGGFYLGASLPFSQKVRLLFEHDGNLFTGGFEIRPISRLGIRLIMNERLTQASAQYSFKF